MRSFLTVVLVVVVPVLAAAQLPRDLSGLARQVPSLNSWLRGAPLTTSFDDAGRQLPVLDRKETPRQARPLRSLPRTATGGFRLAPGLWADTFESYCLRTATHAPGKGDGYLPAPIKGARSAAIQAILQGTVKHPTVPRGDVQMLLWAILSRVRVNEMAPQLQAAARALLPPNEIRAINASGMDVLTAAERAGLRGLTAPVRQALEIESDLRYQFSRADVTYDEVERIAVLSGVRPEDTRNAIKRGQWSRDPRGYFIRFFPDSFANTRVEILVPGRVTVTRDRLNRIIAIEDARGGRTETVYNDAVPPRTHSKNSRLTAYAFKTIRFIRRGTGGRPEVHEIHDQGWTFHRSRPRNRAIAAAPVMRLMNAAFRLPGSGVLQGWFGDWGDRAEQAQDVYERYDFYRERAERATDDPSEDAVDELEDTDHYRDGIDAATSGDPGDRLVWIIEHHERETGALEWAISVLEGLPTTSTTDDPPAWEPGGGVAVPSRGGQTLGISGR